LKLPCLLQTFVKLFVTYLGLPCYSQKGWVFCVSAAKATLIASTLRFWAQATLGVIRLSHGGSCTSPGRTGRLPVVDVRKHVPSSA